MYHPGGGLQSADSHMRMGLWDYCQVSFRCGKDFPQDGLGVLSNDIKDASMLHPSEVVDDKVPQDWDVCR